MRNFDTKPFNIAEQLAATFRAIENVYVDMPLEVQLQGHHTRLIALFDRYLLHVAGVDASIDEKVGKIISYTMMLDSLQEIMDFIAGIEDPEEEADEEVTED